MKNYAGIWLPDAEQHLIDWMKKKNTIVAGKPTYQYDKLAAAMKWVKQFRSAVDVGAHCGLWSMHMARSFETLHAFEPLAEHRDCWEKNLEGSGALLYGFALGDKDASVAIKTAETSTGDSWVDDAETGDIPMRRLDDFALGEVDFIKLDCEGYELPALRGAEQTLIRCQPCVIVEQKPGRAQKFGFKETGAVHYLQDLGAKLRQAISGDYILSWDR